MSDAATHEKLWAMIESIKFAMLTTEDGGQLRARPMAAAQDGFDGTLWFFSRASSPKMGEVQHDQRVGVTYADPASNTYVSLSGTAQVVHDRAAIDAHWSEALKTWFPNGKDDPEVALLKVTCTAAEYWDQPSSTVVQAYGYVKAVLTGQSPNPGEHEKIKLG